MNEDIKKMARGNLIPLWKIAQQVGVSEMTLIRWLRTELPDKRKKQIVSAIERLTQEGV